MSSEIELLSQLKTQMVNFFDELIDSFPEEPDFVIFRIFIKDQIPITDIMNYISVNIVPYQEMIKKRDSAFFLNNNILFEKLDDHKNSKVNHFRKLWLSSKVDEEDRRVIWAWFDSFIYLANKYLELKKSSA
jgi:hypothetical protein